MGAVISSTRFDGILLLTGILLLWWALSAVAGGDALSSPAMTLARIWEMFASDTFWRHVTATTRSFLWALLIVAVGGLGAGLLIGSSRLASDVADPMLGSLYSIPKITLYPIILLIFGLSPSATIAFAAIHGWFPVTIFTMNGLRKVPAIYGRAARSMKLTRWQTITTVLVPAALPEIVAGLRIGFSVTLLGQIIAELFAATSGLGFLLIRATEMHRVVDIMAITVVLLTFAIVANTLLMKLERYVRNG